MNVVLTTTWTEQRPHRTLQEDESMASTAILQEARGQPPKKLVRRTVQLQSRLLKLCEDRRDGLRTVEETLSGLGHNVHL